MAGKKSWLTSYYRLSAVGSISEKLSATCRRSVNGLFAVEIHRALTCADRLRSGLSLHRER
jgi:hypothetical protein